MRNEQRQYLKLISKVALSQAASTTFIIFLPSLLWSGRIFQVEMSMDYLHAVLQLIYLVACVGFPVFILFGLPYAVAGKAMFRLILSRLFWSYRKAAILVSIVLNMILFGAVLYLSRRELNFWFVLMLLIVAQTPSAIFFYKKLVQSETMQR